MTSRFDRSGFCWYSRRGRACSQNPDVRDVDGPKRGRPRKSSRLRPIAPYNSDPQKALHSVFDRATGDPIAPEHLKTYDEVLAQYHLSPEAKFANGQYLDRGRTERRHVVATHLVLIGKEANRVGESGESDPTSPAVTRFTTLSRRIR